MHLIIDGHGGDPKRLGNPKFIYRFLDTCPAQIGMEKVSSPQVFQYTDSGEQEISGFVLLAESHISIHIFPKRAYVNIDVFSCKEFDPEQVAKRLQQRFRLTDVKSCIFNRPPTTHE